MNGNRPAPVVEWADRWEDQPIKTDGDGKSVTAAEYVAGCVNREQRRRMVRAFERAYGRRDIGEMVSAAVNS